MVAPPDTETDVGKCANCGAQLEDAFAVCRNCQPAETQPAGQTSDASKPPPKPVRNFILGSVGVVVGLVLGWLAVGYLRNKILGEALLGVIGVPSLALAAKGFWDMSISQKLKALGVIVGLFILQFIVVFILYLLKFGFSL